MKRWFYDKMSGRSSDDADSPLWLKIAILVGLSIFVGRLCWISYYAA